MRRSTRKWWRVSVSCLATILLVMSSSAPAITDAEIPPDLKPWVPWVLEGHEDLACPIVNDARVCAWPGTLRLDVRKTYGTFELWVRTDRRMAVPLPGGQGAWPRAVTVDERTLPVTEENGRPFVRLEPGTHRVRGSWQWTARPQRLRLPVATGMVDLVLDGSPIAFPAIDKEGWIRLGTQAAGPPTDERLVLDVSRRLADGVPFQVTTRVAIRASGRGREVVFESALVPGTRPVSLAADIPARFGPGGELIMQVRPGNFSLTFDAIHDGPVARLTAPAPGGDWPDREYWVVATDDRVRAVTLRGLAGVDPARTSLPKEWRSLPAYLVHPGDILEFDEIRRGEPEPPPTGSSCREVSGSTWAAPA